MEPEHTAIVVVQKPIDKELLERLVAAHFEDMVKFVADIERGVIAVGGELHADAEVLLLDGESRQQDLWGGNYYPGRGPDECIEFTSLINIRPAQGNRSMLIEDELVRARVRDLAYRLLGQGEALK